MKNCLTCNIAFEPTSNSQKYCCKSCKPKHLGSVQKNCEQCGSQFLCYPYRSSRYCTLACYRASCGTILTPDGSVKRCSNCKQHKPLVDFHKDSNRPSGKSMKCKQCSKKLHAVYRKTAEFKRYLFRTNRTASVRFRKGRLSAEKRGYVWLLSICEYKTLLCQPCHYCGQSTGETGTGLDRKDNSDKYDLSSCVPCCGRCNSTFMNLYDYKEKLQLSEVIRRIDDQRRSQGKESNEQLR